MTRINIKKKRKLILKKCPAVKSPTVILICALVSYWMFLCIQIGNKWILLSDREADFGMMPGTHTLPPCPLSPPSRHSDPKLAALIHALRDSWVREVRSILFSKQKASRAWSFENLWIYFAYSGVVVFTLQNLIFLFCHCVLFVLKILYFLALLFFSVVVVVKYWFKIVFILTSQNLCFFHFFYATGRKKKVSDLWTFGQNTTPVFLHIDISRSDRFQRMTSTLWPMHQKNVMSSWCGSVCH